MNVMDSLQEVSSTMTEDTDVLIEIEVSHNNGISLAEAANALITLQVPSKDPPAPVSSSEVVVNEKIDLAETSPKDFRRKILEGMKSQFNTSTEEDVSTEMVNRRGPHRSKSKFKRINLENDEDSNEVSPKTEVPKTPRGRGRPPKLTQAEILKLMSSELKVENSGNVCKTEMDSSSEGGSERSDSTIGLVTTRRSRRTNISRTSATELLKGCSERQNKKRSSSEPEMLKPAEPVKRRGRPIRTNPNADVSCEEPEVLPEKCSETPAVSLPEAVADNPEICVETSSQSPPEVTVADLDIPVEEVVSKVKHMASLGLQSKSNQNPIKLVTKKKPKHFKGIRYSLGSPKVNKKIQIREDDSTARKQTLSAGNRVLEEGQSTPEESCTPTNDQSILAIDELSIDNSSEQEQDPDRYNSSSVNSLENEVEVSLVDEPEKSHQKINGFDRHEKDPVYSCCCIELRPPIATVPPAATLYCQAVDSAGGKQVGCCLIANRKRFHRPSKKIPFMILCDSHRERIRKHFCCPGCGLFCTQGTFVQCKSVDGSVHFFHAHCQRLMQRRTCLHCDRDQTIQEIRLQMKTCAVPVFCNDAKLLKTMPTAKISLVPRESSATEVELPCPNYISPQLVLPSGKVINSSGIPNSLNKDVLERILRSFEVSTKGSAAGRNLYAAAKHGDIERVIECLRLGQNANTTYPDVGGQTALHAACTNGHLAVVHILIQSGAALDKMDLSQNTPLISSLNTGHNDVVKYLIQSGASTALKAEGGMTSLHFAAKYGNLEACHYIMTLGGGSKFINAQDDGGWTPLVWGCEHERLHIVKYLLQCKANPSLRDTEQNVALHWAAFSGSVDIVSLLLDHGCQVNAANLHGDTPLHTAGRRDNYECVLLLITRGGHLDLRNKEGNLPLEVCPDKQCHSALLLALNAKLQQLTQMPNNGKAEKLLSNDITKGKESSPIQCVNGFDDEQPPEDYIYITENCFTSPLHVQQTINTLQYCQCSGDCSSHNCKCSTLSFRCWYDDEGKLVPEFNFADPPMLFECNRACQCHRSSCNNRLVQHGITARLVLFRIENKGWGVRTSQLIPKGSYVCEYIGEIISDFEADQREDDSYLFDLDNKDGETYCIDARRYGNIARFINHSCEPNLIPVKVYIDHQDLKFPRIAFFAARDIEVNEELAFDYGDKFWIIKYKSFTCACLSAKCKYDRLTIQRTVEEYRKCLQEDYFPN